MGEIRLENVDKSYGDKEIIKSLSLTIEDGSFTVLVGPSGCGKSTILRIIAGLEKKTGGNVFIGNKNVEGVEPGKRNLAMVFQNYALYPTMTVRQNIEFGLKNIKIPKQERDRLIDEVTGIVGLTAHLEKKPQFLSGGERQRVALARAMVKKPAVFLMDEPLSNLDAKLRQQLRLELIELHNRLGATFLYVTHDQVEAMSMGTKIVLMDNGRIMQEDTAHDIYNYPKNVFSSKFIGSPPMNVLELGELSEYLPTPLPAGVKFVGFRPEKAKIAENRRGSGGDGLSLEATVTGREMLGSEILYSVELTNKRKLAVKVMDDTEISQLEYGTQIGLFISSRHIIFFNDAEERVTAPYRAESKVI
ncbi:sn-glycerol 3-phosphate transport system ATP-binding protein [Sporobacter termitidis DSM 10068]|uniref:sn-glycerol 3-phosphate transport system ATP-binding protein n=1 Tax=Sporobacter termitidis DSM 10068 TaxID=1123282 RepID=A0A1M5VQV6_9FIRM|nr:ABC transporter ATP-binding protein [Sporobacter termitidis]SHH77374.1 sn-glycerol 3-phosphate transport system ATP-binding protein [Sporobacter termitidis DSM 10068]